MVCRTDEDDFLLLASDGLWDVMSNQVSLAPWPAGLPVCKVGSLDVQPGEPLLRHGLQALPHAHGGGSIDAALHANFLPKSVFLTLSLFVQTKRQGVVPGSRGSPNHVFARLPPLLALLGAAFAPLQEATNLCTRCIKRAREKGASRNAAVRIAASVLTKAAIDRGSKDNVTVVIVDLRNEKSGGGSGMGAGAAAAAQPAAGETSSVGQAPACGDTPRMLKPPQEAERGAVELPAPPAAADPASGISLAASSCGCGVGSCSCGGCSGGDDGGGSRLVKAVGCAVAVAAQEARASG